MKDLSPINILNMLNNLLEDGVRIDGKTGGYSDRTIKYQHQILSSILQQAFYWQLIPNNPCKRVKVPKNKDYKKYKITEINFFTEEQIKILIPLINNEHIKYRTAFMIALTCGLRKGEILGLTWNDIDFKNKKIQINKSRSYIPGKGLITKKPKSKSSIRTISFSDVLNNVLKEYKIWQNKERLKYGNLWDSKWDKQPWLFTQWNGKGMDYNTLTKWLKKTIEKYNKQINLNPEISSAQKKKKILPSLGFHSLRHTSATLLIDAHTNIKTVSSRLGHSKTSTTMNIYVHNLEKSDEDAAKKLDNIII